MGGCGSTSRFGGLIISELYHNSRLFHRSWGQLHNDGKIKQANLFRPAHILQGATTVRDQPRNHNRRQPFDPIGNPGGFEPDHQRFEKHPGLGLIADQFFPQHAAAVLVSDKQRRHDWNRQHRSRNQIKLRYQPGYLANHLNCLHRCQLAASQNRTFGKKLLFPII